MEDKYVEDAEIIREKGTNRSKFHRGEIDKYTWVNVGSSYLPSELNAAYLLGQLELSGEIMLDRMDNWKYYADALTPLMNRELIELPHIPVECEHCAHMFYIKSKDIDERSALIKYLKQNGVHAVFHYIPLHSSPAGKQYSYFYGTDKYTTMESERLLRLPLYYGMTQDDKSKVVEYIFQFYE